jgi:hypothetical protein
MALKHPPPLDDKAWNSLMKQLNENPTEEYMNMLQQAAENGKKIKTYS